MRTKIKYNVVALLVGMFVLPVSYGYEKSSSLSIIEIRQLDGNTYFTLSANAICGTSTLTIDATTNGGKAMFSTLLTAAAAGKKVTVGHNQGVRLVDSQQSRGQTRAIKGSDSLILGGDRKSKEFLMKNQRV